MTPTPELIAEITRYLSLGGLFNPELAHHDAVRDLLIECREALSRERASEISPIGDEWRRQIRLGDCTPSDGRALLEEIERLERALKEQA